jgi:hypothetical protein
MTFLHNCIQPDAVLMLFVALMCLLGYGVPAYQGRATGGFVWFLWLACGILAIVAWVLLVIS